MTRIDAHQHFWRYNPKEHVWMTEAMDSLKQDFLPEDLKPILQEHGFEGCIAVQASSSLDETRWLLQLAGENDFLRGIVGWVDLCSPEVVLQLEEFSAHPKFLGVRHQVQDEPDDYMTRSEFRRGIASLAPFDLAYDLLVFPRQLPAATALVRAFPEQRFVLDHIAKPPIATRERARWESEIRKLASQSNVCCKLSGMVTEARWQHWTADDFQPYLDVVFDAFGPERLMFGSDWPVCTLSADYASTLCLVTDYVRRFAAEYEAGIFGDVCARVYKRKSF